VVSSLYFDKNANGHDPSIVRCDVTNSVPPAGFYPLSYDAGQIHQWFWQVYPFPVGYITPNASAMVDGFFGGCIPFDAILASTLDCLYNINCLEAFSDYFPALHQVCMTLFLIFHKTLFLSRQI